MSLLEWWVLMIPTGPGNDRFNKVKSRLICARGIRVAEPGRTLAQPVALARLCVQPVAFLSTVVLERFVSGQPISTITLWRAQKH